MHNTLMPPAMVGTGLKQVIYRLKPVDTSFNIMTLTGSDFCATVCMLKNRFLQTKVPSKQQCTWKLQLHVPTVNNIVLYYIHILPNISTKCCLKFSFQNLCLIYAVI